jgi:hypothetical protein
MSLCKSRFSIAVMWAMLPLTVFGSMPRMGCICANGQRKVFCERHRMDARDANCVCCFGRAAAKPETARETGREPAGERACCMSKRLAPNGQRLAVGAGAPCRSVVDRPAFVTAAKVVLDLDQSSHERLLSNAVPISAIVSQLGCENSRGHEPLRPDLITTLGVLLI